jgi:predicted dinucleotide-binding enzyme
MTYAFVGSGAISSALGRRFVANGIAVAIANAGSRESPVACLGAETRTALSS